MNAPALVNPAVEETLSGYGWLVRQEPTALRKHSPERVSLAREIYRFALNYTINWQQVSLAEALVEVREALPHGYPFLTVATVARLGGHFASACN